MTFERTLETVEASVAEQAAAWIVRLTVDDAAERRDARAGFEHWKQQDPRHADAAARMEGFVERVQRLCEGGDAQRRPARAALAAAFGAERKRGRGRRAGLTLLLVMALALPLWLASQVVPLDAAWADLRTSAGEWQTHTLDDGTRITLNGSSAVKLRFDAQARRVELLRGDILVDVAHDATRPFLVNTRHGSLRALGTRFVVSRAPEATVLTMLESSVSAQAVVDPGLARRVDAGQRVRIDAQGIGPLESIDVRSVSEAWRAHQLVVQGQSLPEVLDTLARHRRGYLLYDRARLAHIRVSAVLPLDDTDRVLELLVAGFPELEIRKHHRWLVRVDLRADAGGGAKE